jgi:tetratricopeptide (TPR) repeat protein
VTRKVWILLLSSAFWPYAAHTQQAPAPQAGTPPAASPQQAPLPDEGNIPEEDENEQSHETEYHFNPIRAKKEYDVGMFYMHKNSYRAAIKRFTEATRWNPNWEEAYLKLGEAQAKLKHNDDARKSLAKVIELAPNSKEAKEAKKLSAKLESPH